MNKKAILFCFITILAETVYGQCPPVNFSIPVTACLNEQIYPDNLSFGASSFEWDFCSGDFELTPAIQNIGTNSSLNRGRSVRITEISGGNWVGFAIDQASNRLVRFEFGESLQNTPSIVNLGNPESILARAYDFELINEAGNWYLIAINSTTNDLIRMDFGPDLLNEAPTTVNLGSFSELNTPNNIRVINEMDNLYVFISNGGTNSITRLEFGGSLLNNPSATSFSITGINNPRGIDIVKDCDKWIGLVTSYSGNKIFYLDFVNGLSQTPTTGEVSFFTGYNFPAVLKIIYEGGQYYSMIQSALGDLYKLSFGTSISDLTGTGQNLGDFGLNDNFACEWINVGTDWYGFSIELSNPATPGAGNLIRYTFPTTCNAVPAVSINKNPVVKYDGDGSNQITLIAYDDSNNISSANQSITISPSLAPQLSAQITGNCLSSPLNFAGQELSGNITDWNWDFGDGTGTSTLQNPAYSYGSAGEYQVKLSATDANGCNNLYIDTARVYEEPIPAFTIPPGNLCMNNSILFTNSTTGETGDPVTWTWDFNGEGTSTEKEPLFTFLTPGDKVVTLTSSLPGCSNTSQQTITIEEAPTVTFSFDRVCNGQATTFTDLTTGNNLTSWSWDFGDGNTSSDQNPSHTYSNAGEYSVTLTVENDLGCSTSMTETVYSYPPPAVSFNYDLPCSSSPFQFFDQSTALYTNVVNWEWDFGDGNISSEQNPLHLYGQTGNYTVKLKAYSEIGCVDSLETMISVIQGPEADFTYDNGCSGEETSFTDQTNNFGLPIISYEWLIEGQTYTGSNVQHRFETSGTYKVNLSVRTSNQCTQSIEKDVVITDVQTTLFDVSEDCKSGAILFTDTTAGDIASRVWLIDGTFLSSDSLFTTDLAPNDYLISLRTTSNSGCENISNQEVSIFGIPRALYSSNISYGAVPLSVNFLNESEGATSYFWQFGDDENQTSTEANPQFTFNEIGDYNVTLIASAEQNCSDTIVQRISVVEPNNNLVIEELVPLQTGQLNLTLNNKGSITYNKSNCQLVFTLDNGAEIREPLDSTLYPLEEIQYIPNFQLGTTGNSQVLCVTLELSQEQEILNLDKACFTLNDQSIITDAYPNPSSDYFNLSVVLSKPEPVTIRLIDSNGGTLLSISDDSTREGLNEYKIDARPYLAGLYIIKIESSSVSKEMKVVINK